MAAIPEDEIAFQATTEDGTTVDTRVSVNHPLGKGFSVSVFAEAKLGEGKPKGAAGFEIRKKLRRR